MMAIAPDPSALATEEAVHAEGDPDREAAHSVRELGLVVGLEDHVKVVGLDRVVNDAEALAASAAGILHRAEQHAMKTLAPKARKALRTT